MRYLKVNCGLYEAYSCGRKVGTVANKACSSFKMGVFIKIISIIDNPNLRYSVEYAVDKFFRIHLSHTLHSRSVPFMNLNSSSHLNCSYKYGRSKLFSFLRLHIRNFNFFFVYLKSSPIKGLKRVYSHLQLFYFLLLLLLERTQSSVLSVILIIL